LSSKNDFTTLNINSSTVRTNNALSLNFNDLNQPNKAFMWINSFNTLSDRSNTILKNGLSQMTAKQKSKDLFSKEQENVLFQS
jgi:hypothetical protein